MCVCVRVCVRERERKRVETRFIGQWEIVCTCVSSDSLCVCLVCIFITSCISQVHSQRSVAAIAAKKIETEKNSNEAKLSCPKIITHSDDEGTRLANKKNIQNLPYINRNPSV